MRAVDTPDNPSAAFYLPHHAVAKPSDQGKKIRVVFNASAKTTTGYSLNDCMLPGPKLQAELWLVLTRWRLFKFAFTADVVQMFRQINVHSSDQDRQRILWRSEPSQPIKEFCLTTVTYGTASAPYLALRTLLQLATDESNKYPYGAIALQSHTYVDDILYGGSTLPQALDRKNQLTGLLSAGGFALSKWAANQPGLCPDPSVSERLFADSEGISTLGVLWSAKADTFQLRVTPTCNTTAATKRTVLSDIARFFDPLGWATPVLIYGRIFLQELWKIRLAWDDPLPTALSERWVEFVTILSNLTNISVPRYIRYSSENCEVSLHGFSDASEKAYAAVVYLRCVLGSTVAIHLIVARSKVAPLSAVSIPRLELCGALLLAKLLKATATGINFATVPWYLWTDAQVVLRWLQGHPSRWIPYVAHRVTAIQEIVSYDRWNYVPTESNPADLCTRGIDAVELQHSTLWWHGPSWLIGTKREWPKWNDVVESDVITEVESAARRVHVAATPALPTELLARYSTLTRLLRVVALCLRFKHNALQLKSKRDGFLTAEELRLAKLKCIQMAQTQDFASEIGSLTRREQISSRSALLPLRPILTSDGILRVGGRLAFAQIPEERRHPIILGKTNPLSLLFLRHAHALSLHGGPQLMRSIISGIWIIHGNVLAKKVVRECVRCIRHQATTLNQQMGSLPEERVVPSRPFLSTGVDFAGPFSVTAYRARGVTSQKSYLALFVCLASKAIHIEIVSDLSTAAFLAAFKRFTARRGHCATLFSDNATNFRGADKELKAMYRDACTSLQGATALLAGLNTEWKFIPPSAPHFGGLWEAGVKAVKRHLRRIVGDQTLSMEEMTTLTCQIEACLNSRPLCQISNSPSDFSALTPGHLLVGEALINLPETSYHEYSERHPLSRWQHLSRMRDHFWHRWSMEYLQKLQHSQRWHRERSNVTVGTLVLISDQLNPPARWLLGRVTDVHPGSDGLVRVVTLRTANGIIKRPIHKLCSLPTYPLPSD